MGGLVRWKQCVELDPQEFGVHPLGYRNDPFDHHFTQPAAIESIRLQLPSDWQEYYVGAENAVDGGHKRHGNTAPDLVEVLEVLHHLYQSEDGPDDADRGSIPSRGFPDAHFLFSAIDFDIGVKTHHFAENTKVGSVRGQTQSLPKKRVFHLKSFALKGRQAHPAGPFSESC